MIQVGSSETMTTRDGRRWTVRPGRPTDGRALARLFAVVRAEGRWLIATPGAISEPSEAFWISELIGASQSLALVAESDADVIGNVLVSVDRGRATEHIGVLSICVAADWRNVGIGSELVAGAQAWARERGLRKISLGVFPDNERAIAVYERHGFVHEGIRRQQYRSGDEYRDEVLMAWFPAEVTP
ncbi:MAG: GNAT family N-acetyltransferase [Chloroflexota bacterium]|nr:GNAT family N-acetyltransferase [Chloroflexota bacterium]